MEAIPFTGPWLEEKNSKGFILLQYMLPTDEGFGSSGLISFLKEKDLFAM